MVVSAPALDEALARVVGREHLTSDPAALARHAIDGVVPRWVARPGDVDGVSALMALAHGDGLAVAPRGSGAALSLGNPPRRLDLVLDLTRLRAVTEYVPDDLVASVQAGLPLNALAGRLSGNGQMLALDPIGGASRTIGGVLATNASGPRRFRHGAGRDLLLGVRFVQADGTVTWGGAKVVKSVTGYEVPKLLVGSLGTLAVIVEATLRLCPLPSATGSWLLALPSGEAAAGLLAALLDSSLEPDRVTLLAGGATRVCGLSAPELAIMVSVGSVEEAVESQGAALARLASAHDARAHAVPGSLWDALAEPLAPILLKVLCEPKRVVFWLGELERLSSRLGLAASSLVQPGNGVLNVALEGEVPGAAFAGNLLGPLREGLGPEGGGVVVERAPVHLKAGFDVWGSIHPELLAIMSRLKQQFDPSGILNPGRFVGGL
jgi:glycolate oxidase FAD binding subunit